MAAETAARCQLWQGLLCDPSSSLLKLNLSRLQGSPWWLLVTLTWAGCGSLTWFLWYYRIFQSITIMHICIKICTLDDYNVWRFRLPAFRVFSDIYYEIYDRLWTGWQENWFSTNWLSCVHQVTSHLESRSVYYRWNILGHYDYKSRCLCWRPTCNSPGILRAAG